MGRASLANKLRYKLPRFKLCLVREGTKTADPFPVKSPEDAAQFLEPLRHASEEHFVTLHLNSRHEIIGLHEVSHGTLSASLVHPREVFKAALLNNSHAMLVCHNHPSGSQLTPSQEDVDTTKQLLEAGNILGITILDHLILSPRHQVFSIRENMPELWS